MKHYNLSAARKTLCMGIFLCTGLMAGAQGNLQIRHLANEQNILTLKEEKKYLLLPVQDNAPEGKIYFVINNQNVGSGINVRLAREKVDYYVQDVPSVAWDLIELTTKPLTIIYDGARNLAPNLLAEDGSVGIRVTNEAFSKELCFRFRKAIVSTSANISGEPSPAVFREISEEIKSAVDYIVDFRREETGHPKPSSIIKLGKGGEVKIIRE